MSDPTRPRTTNGIALVAALRKPRTMPDPEVDWPAWIAEIEDQAALSTTPAAEADAITHPMSDLTQHDAHEIDRLTRGRPLTDGEIACYLADHQTALRHGTARVGDEIAELLRDRLALSTTPAADLTDALWQCAVLSGMDTDGDTGPGALIAGMGVEGFARMVVEEVRRLRESYEEGLREPLDAAWAAAEAALPEGWRGPVLRPSSIVSEAYQAQSFNEDGDDLYEYADTPAAALLALAEKLREPQP